MSKYLKICVEGGEKENDMKKEIQTNISTINPVLSKRKYSLRK